MGADRPAGRPRASRSRSRRSRCSPVSRRRACRRSRPRSPGVQPGARGRRRPSRSRAACRRCCWSGSRNPPSVLRRRRVRLAAEPQTGRRLLTRRTAGRAAAHACRVIVALLTPSPARPLMAAQVSILRKTLPIPKAFATRPRIRCRRVDEIRVIVRRGDVVEATHVVHAVAVRDGAVIEQAGDADRVAYLRSSAKPFQALPLVRARDDLTSEEIAIASASHLASPEQLAAVRSLLAKAPAGEDELECGPGEPTDPPAQLLGQARRHARALPCAGLGKRRLPARDASGPARLSRGDRVRLRRPRRRDPDGGRRVRRRHLRAPARADGPPLLAAGRGRRRRPGGCRDARAPGADPRADGRRHAC